MTLGNNNITLNKITVDLFPYESRNTINMTASTSSDNVLMNITVFNETLVKFYETPSPNNSEIPVSYSIGDRIPNQTYSINIYDTNGTRYQYFNVLSNDTGYINYNSTVLGLGSRYQEITVGQPIDTTYTITLPKDQTYLRFNASRSTVTNLDPDGQNSSQPIFNIINNGNINLSFMLNLSDVVSNITTYADLDSNFSSGKIEINTSPTTVIPNLIPNSSQNVWMVIDANNAPVTNVNKTLIINNS